MESEHEELKISRDLFYQALKKKWTVFGTILESLTVPIGDLPPEFSENVLTLVRFHERIIELPGNMIHSFISLILLKKGYLGDGLKCISKADEKTGKEEFVDFIYSNDFELGLYNEYDDFRIKDATPGLQAEAYSSFFHWKDDIMYDYYHNTFGRFITFSNPDNRDDVVRISILWEWPFAGPDFFHYSFDMNGVQGLSRLYMESDSKKTAKKKGKKFSEKNYLVVDPILNHFFHPFVEQVKNYFETHSQDWTVLSPEEFLVLFLPSEKEDFLEEYQNHLNKLTSRISRDYPFISIISELSMISRAREEIVDSLHRSESKNLNQREIENTIRAATRGVEGLLLSLYKVTFGIPPPRNHTFGDLITKLHSVIEMEFGEDITSDLNFLNKIRNLENHPNEYLAGENDLIKVVSRSNEFLRLFDSYLEQKKHL